MSDVDAIIEERSREWSRFGATKEQCRACASEDPLSGNAVLASALLPLGRPYWSRKSQARETPDGPLCENHWVYFTVACDVCHTGRHLLTSQACIECEIKLSKQMRDYLPSPSRGLDDYAPEIPHRESYDNMTRRLHGKGKKRTRLRPQVTGDRGRHRATARGGAGAG